MDELKMKEYGVNEEQYEALDISKNIALRAGAGSGKTRVLTKRFLRLLKEVDNAGIENIVAITFTNKAALEMKERIRKAVAEEIEKESTAEGKKRWRAIRDNITIANINTIHGFCGRIIRENFFYLGIDPGFKVIEEVDKETNLEKLTDEAIDFVFSMEANLGAVKVLLENCTTKVAIESELRDSITSIYHKIREKGLNLYEVEKISSPESKKEFLNQNGMKYDNDLMLQLNIIENLLLRILKKLDSDYARFKEKQNVLDFNDLEILAAKALENRDIRDRYSSSFRFILVDEFQDTNSLQERIIYSLASDETGSLIPGKLFVVGDHKQSIYGFRGTDYTIFNRVCDDISRNGDIKFLSNCYRSTPQIVDTINGIFKHLITPYEELKVPEDGRGNSGKKVELILLEKENGGNGSKNIWDTIKKSIGNGQQTEILKSALAELGSMEQAKDKTDMQGEVLSGRIACLKKDGIEYKDMAVLLRSRTNLQSIENSLRRHGIPYSVLGGIGFWGKQEIIDIINLYRFVSDQEDLLSLAGALRSPIFSFSDDILMELFVLLKSRESSLPQALGELGSRLDGIEKERVDRAARILGKLTSINGFLNACSLLIFICREICYRQILLTQTNGFQKVRNLEKLFNIAKEFDSGNMYSAWEFPGYLEILEVHSSSDGEAVLDTEDSNAVKILTIHASKGLEFKAVLIPDMSREVDWNTARNKPVAVFDEEFGITAVPCDENGSRIIEGNPVYTVYHKRLIDRELDDSRRILYVAATRAREFLAFIGTDQDYRDSKGKEKLNSFMRQIKYAIDRNEGGLEHLEILSGASFIQAAGISASRDIADIDNSLHQLKQYGNAAKSSHALLKSCDGEVSGMFSISRYLKYLDCPRLYFYEYKAGLATPMLLASSRDEIRKDEENETEEAGGRADGISASIMGTIVHRILEEMTLNSVGDITEIAMLAERILNDYFPGMDHDQFEELTAEAGRYLENYLLIENKIKGEFKGNRIKVCTELGFRIPVQENGSVMTNGFVDRVDIYDSGDTIDLYIIDYKTNKIREPGDMDKKVAYYKPQVVIYSKSLEKLLRLEGKKARIAGVYLYFLDSAEYRKVEFCEQDVDNLLADIAQKVDKIFRSNSMENFECRFGNRCQSCEFREICL